MKWNLEKETLFLMENGSIVCVGCNGTSTYEIIQYCESIPNIIGFYMISNIDYAYFD